MTRSTNFNQLQGNLILASTIIGAGMVYLDGTIITVALEPIRDEFGAGVSDLQWLHTIYLLFLTVPILVAGSLSDRYGRRRLFNIGLLGFTLASAACGAAGSMNQLNLARGFQGAFGGIMLPGSLAILNATFPPTIRGKTVGTWSAFTALTTAIGPLLGGWLVDVASWRMAFFINVPLGVIALLLSFRYIPESKNDDVPERLDWLGVGLVTVGLASLIYGLIEGPVYNWAEAIHIYALVAGILMLFCFGVWETQTEHPMVPISLFKNRVFTGITLITLILYFAMSGVFFFLPLLMQQVHNLSATLTGSLLMPLIILLFFMSQWAGHVADRSGSRWLLIIGSSLIAGGLFLCMLPAANIRPIVMLASVPYDSLVFLSYLPATVVFGFGLGLTVAPLTTVALAAVPREMSGLASGLSNAASRVATILAVAILGAIIIGRFSVSLEKHISPLPLSPEHQAYMQEERLKLGAAEPPPNLSPLVTNHIQRAIDNAFVYGFRAIMGICGVLALTSAVITFFMIDDRMMVAQRQIGTSQEFEITSSTPHV